jgi:hypothetical protein
LSFCYALQALTKAIMNYDDSDLQRASIELDNTQKLCKSFLKNLNKTDKKAVSTQSFSVTHDLIDSRS